MLLFVTMTKRFFALVLALSWIGCATVPDLSYDDASITSEAGDSAPSTDSGSVNIGDAGTPDNFVDAHVACDPSHLPDGATQCCTDTPCVDRQGLGCNCGDCVQRCTGGKWCCVNKNGDLSCKAGATDCK
jgi:hypothetical protein